MSATRAKSRAQQIYDLAAKGIESVRYAENVLEDQGDTCHRKIVPSFSFTTWLQYRAFQSNITYKIRRTCIPRFYVRWQHIDLRTRSNSGWLELSLSDDITEKLPCSSSSFPYLEQGQSYSCLSFQIKLLTVRQLR